MAQKTEVEVGATYTQDAIKMCELVSTDGSRGLKDGLLVLEADDGNTVKVTERQFNHYWTKMA